MNRGKFLRVFRSKKENQRHWTRTGEDDSSKLKCFTPEKLKRWFNFLVDNIYLQFSKDKILRQRIGIPMGTNCAVFVANLFCFTYEFDFISRLIEQNRLDVVSQFRFTIRFVDDLLTYGNPIFLLVFVLLEDRQSRHVWYLSLFTYVKALTNGRR